MHSEFAGFFLVLFFLVLPLAKRFGPALFDTIALAFAGEQGSLMPRGLLGHGARIRRAIDLQSVISRLAVITRLNLPLGPAVAAAMKSDRGRLQSVFRKLDTQLRNGLPVSEALLRAVPGCPTQLIVTLKRAEACGQLTEALSQQERMIGAMIDDQFRFTAHTRHALLYALFMLAFCGLMVCWLVIFFFPKFKEIFLDFEVVLPGVTLTLLWFVDWLASQWLVILVIATILGAALTFFAYTLNSRKPGWPASIVAAARSTLPATRGLDFGWGMARVIRSLALNIRSGSPSPFSEDLTSVVAATNPLRFRIQNFIDRIAQGESPHLAARATNLGDAFVCALRMVERGEDPDRTLAFAANYYELIAYRWWYALNAVMGPLVTLCAGFMVGFVAVAMFLPLVALIHSVSAWIP